MVENTDRNKQNTGCNGNLHYLPLANHLALLPAKRRQMLPSERGSLAQQAESACVALPSSTCTRTRDLRTNAAC